MRHAFALWGLASLCALALAPDADAAMREVQKAAETVTTSPACDNLVASVHKRIDRIKSLQHALQTARYAPSSALAGEGNSAAADTARTITREHETAAQMNGMLANLGCTPLDIEAELARPSKPSLEPLNVAPRVPDPSSILPSISPRSTTGLGTATTKTIP